MICYFDASAFVKLMLPELGSGEALDLWRRADHVLSSRLLYPEGRSAVARAVRAGRLQRRRGRQAREVLETLWRDVDVIELGPPLAKLAGDLAEQHSLKASDAVHLAAATAMSTSPLVFVASDLALTDAARRDGFTVAAV
jgi:uncharacterized protein